MPLGSGLLFAACFRAVQHLIPVFGPGFSPGHVASTCAAQLGGQKLLIAFEWFFHKDQMVKR